MPLPLPIGRRRATTLSVALVLAVVGLSACRAHTVRVGFRPKVGSRAVYEVAVTTSSVAQFEGQKAQRTHESVRLRVEQRVLASTGAGSRVQVTLSPLGASGSARDATAGVLRFVVRLDRSAQLIAVERVAGLPTGVLGDIGLSEVFPAAATPPDGQLTLGQHWSRATAVELPGSPRAQLRTRGRLAELDVRHRRSVATIVSTATLPVTRTLAAPEGTIELDGSQRTTATTTAVIADGTIETSTATTSATLDLRLVPAESGAVNAVNGKLSLTVRSRTTRIA